MPIRFFEAWIDWIVGFDGGDTRDASSYYRAKYRDDYAVDGLKITKFEKSSPAANSREEAVRRGQPATSLTYGFVKAYPISINSMPVSYEASSLLGKFKSTCKVPHCQSLPIASLKTNSILGP